MAFKIYEPKQIEFNPLEEGIVAIDRTGTARFVTDDLTIVGIETSAIVLTDELTLRVAIRKPRPGEKGKAMTVAYARQGKLVDKTRAHVRLTGALHALRLDTEATKGRYPLTTKDDLLIINLADCKTDAADDDEDDGGKDVADKG